MNRKYRIRKLKKEIERLTLARGFVHVRHRNRVNVRSQGQLSAGELIIASKSKARRIRAF